MIMAVQKKDLTEGTCGVRDKRRLAFTAVAAIMGLMLGILSEPSVQAHIASGRRIHSREVKVMIVTMFGPEAKISLDHLGPWDVIKIPGLPVDYPDVHCNRRRQKALAIDPHSYIAHALLGQTYRSLGRTDEASREFQFAEQIQAAAQPKIESPR